MRDLLEEIPHVGKVEWIGRSPAREAEIEVVESAEIRVGSGIVGDHHASSATSQRQVTLIQSEHLPVIAQLSGCERLSPVQCRRNVVVGGINLLSLKKRRFRIGDVVLEGTGPCAPCSRMERTIGPGAYQAMRGHGGITAIVHQSGMIRVGDTVHALPTDD